MIRPERKHRSSNNHVIEEEDEEVGGEATVPSFNSFATWKRKMGRTDGEGGGGTAAVETLSGFDLNGREDGFGFGRGFGGGGGGDLESVSDLGHMEEDSSLEDELDELEAIDAFFPEGTSLRRDVEEGVRATRGITDVDRRVLIVIKRVVRANPRLRNDPQGYDSLRRYVKEILDLGDGGDHYANYRKSLRRR